MVALKEYFYHSFLLTILTGPDWALGPLFYPEEGLPAHIINILSYLTHIDPETEAASLSDTLAALLNMTLLQLSKPDLTSAWYQLVICYLVKHINQCP